MRCWAVRLHQVLNAQPHGRVRRGAGLQFSQTRPMRLPHQCSATRTAACSRASGQNASGPRRAVCQGVAGSQALQQFRVLGDVHGVDDLMRTGPCIGATAPARRIQVLTVPRAAGAARPARHGSGRAGRPGSPPRAAWVQPRQALVQGKACWLASFTSMGLGCRLPGCRPATRQSSSVTPGGRPCVCAGRPGARLRTMSPSRLGRAQRGAVTAAPRQMETNASCRTSSPRPGSRTMRSARPYPWTTVRSYKGFGGLVVLRSYAVEGEFHEFAVGFEGCSCTDCVGCPGCAQ